MSTRITITSEDVRGFTVGELGDALDGQLSDATVKGRVSFTGRLKEITIITTEDLA